jgi:acyl dehydratase
VTATISSIEVGAALPPQRYPVRRGDLVRYAGASGDFNPIHWNARVATSVGLPDVIAHGMLTMGLVARAVTTWFADPGALVDYGVRFTRPVVVPDPGEAVLEVTGVVASVEGGRVAVNLTATVNGQTVLAKARAVVRAG